MTTAGSTAEQPADLQSSRGRSDEVTSWCRVHLQQSVSTDGKEQPTVILCAQTEVKGKKTLQLGADFRLSTAVRYWHAVRAQLTSGRITWKSVGSASITSLWFNIHKHPSLFEGMTSLVKQRVCQQNTGQTCLPPGQLERKRLLLRIRRLLQQHKRIRVTPGAPVSNFPLRGAGLASDLMQPCLY